MRPSERFQTAWAAFYKRLGFLVNCLKQTVNHAVVIHVDFLGRRHFRQPRHFHHIAAQGHDKAGAGGYGDAAHGDGEALGAAQ